MSLPVPAPATVPRARPSIETLSRKEKARRQKAGPKTRLTEKLVDDVVARARLATPLKLCLASVGVSWTTYYRWMRLAEEAEKKKWRERTQLEIRCLEFRERLRQAEGEAGLRVHTAIADAAGLTATRPRATTTRTKIVGGTLNPNGSIEGGQLVDATVTVTELLPDWRAAAKIGSYRWPEEMADVTAPEPEGTGGPPVSAKALFDRVQQIRAQRAEQGIDDSDVIDATAVVNPPEEP